MAQPHNQHYHLVSGLVLFQHEGAEGMASVTLNTVLRSALNKVPARQIGRAQQALQMLLHQRIEGPPVQVVDVTIMSISYLGFMSEEEFNRPPEGTTTQEVLDQAEGKPN